MTTTYTYKIVNGNGNVIHRGPKPFLTKPGANNAAQWWLRSFNRRLLTYYSKEEIKNFKIEFDENYIKDKVEAGTESQTV